jgi:hypothetical protein
MLTYGDMFLLHGKRSLYSSKCEFTRPKFWTPPPEDWIMINVDAAVFEAKNCMGIGLVARNHKDDFLATVRQEIDKTINPELAETLAVRCAILFANQFQYSRVVVAYDYPSLISKLKSNAVDRSHTGTIVEEIRK